MLNKRAQILFEDNKWKNIWSLAKTKGISVAQLVRQAVDQQYFSGSDLILTQRRQAWAEILRIRPHFKGKLDYERMINYGRER